MLGGVVRGEGKGVVARVLPYHDGRRGHRQGLLLLQLLLLLLLHWRGRRRGLRQLEGRLRAGGEHLRRGRAGVSRGRLQRRRLGRQAARGDGEDAAALPRGVAALVEAVGAGQDGGGAVQLGQLLLVVDLGALQLEMRKSLISLKLCLQHFRSPKNSSSNHFP